MPLEHYTVTSTANETIAELNTVSTATLAIAGSTFTITNGTGAGVQAGTISVANGATLVITGTFDNSGTIALNSTGTATDLTIAGSATLSGTGKVTLSNNAGNAVISNGAAATLTNVGNTISGAGTIGDSYLTLVNQGTINANQTKALVINTGGNTITNSGTLEATSSGGLDIESNVSNSKTIEALGTNAKVVIESVITNAATGLILASGSGAQVDLDGATISGGTLQTSGSNAMIETVSGSANVLDGGTISSGSTVEINSGTTLTLSGTIDNIGTIALNSTGAATDLTIAGSATLSGTGKVTLSNNAGNAVISNGAAATLTNVGNTISGAGTIGDSNLTLVNQGTINANQSKALVINTGGNAITNSGTLEATSSGGLDIESNVSNSKTIEALGTNAKVVIESVITDAATGLIVASGSGAQVDLDGATISGGTLQTSGSNALIETVSGSADVLDGVTISSGSTVEINSGTTLTLGGTVTNSGTLLVNGGTLNIDGVVTGGTAEIGGIGSVVIAQASSENVAFLAGSTGKLVLDQATSYTGKISGFGAKRANPSISPISISRPACRSVMCRIAAIPPAFLQSRMARTPPICSWKVLTRWQISRVASDGNGGTLITDPTVVTQKPGNAPATIGNNTVLDINTPDTGTVTFAGTTGTLWLDQPSTFTGKVSGFGAQDVIDLPGIAFDAEQRSAIYRIAMRTGGTLSVTDGTHSANIALLGNYMASSFVMESDNHGGTMVVAEASQTSNQTLLTTSQHA